MKIRSIIILLAVVMTILSCGPSKNSEISKINEMETSLFDEKGGMVSLEKANELVNAYIKFAGDFPGDSMASEYLFKAADISMNINQAQQAIDLYDRIIAEYPDFRKAAECLFLKGYVYENSLGDLQQAEAIYREFIEKYPDNDFADDAEISIQNLGKSPEDLIREFEEKMKAQEE